MWPHPAGIGARHTGGWCDGSALQQHTEFPTTCRRPERVQGFGLHLPNTFAGHSKDLPDLLKRLLVPPPPARIAAEESPPRGA